MLSDHERNVPNNSAEASSASSAWKDGKRTAMRCDPTDFFLTGGQTHEFVGADTF
jgi:hypothetical protein